MTDLKTALVDHYMENGKPVYFQFIGRQFVREMGGPIVLSITAQAFDNNGIDVTYKPDPMRDGWIAEQRARPDYVEPTHSKDGV